MDPKRLAGKNVVITGAAQGMGAANAVFFAAQGANVVLGDLNVDGAKAVADAINAEGNGKAIAVSMNVTKREDHTAAVQACVDAFGSINVYLNNAGVNKPKMFLDIDDENWDLIMNVNAKGMLYGMQEATKQMIKQGPMQDHPYKIINVGSILSRAAFLDVIPYSCSKHAVLAMNRHEIFWFHQCQHQFLLLLATMSGSVNVIYFTVNNSCPSFQKQVDDAVDAGCVARNR